MSVLEGGIYFEELVGLPSRHLALLLLGLLLALLGAIFMGIAGFVAGVLSRAALCCVVLCCCVWHQFDEVVAWCCCGAMWGAPQQHRFASIQGFIWVPRPHRLFIVVQRSRSTSSTTRQLPASSQQPTAAAAAAQTPCPCSLRPW
jgi:hypothetical protein